jgi:hypothetical protein
MKLKILYYAASVALAAGLVQNVSAQNYQWSAGGDKTSWSDGANWTQLTPPPADNTPFQIDLFANAGTNRTPINIASSDAVQIQDSMFGPLWGETLNVHGTVVLHWGQFIWGDLNGGVTTMNLYSNAVLTARDTIATGTAWWFPGGPNVVVNVYSNAFMGCAWLQHGGRLNLYGGTVSVTNGLNTGSANGPVFGGGLDTDATRSINLTAGSTLVLPASYTTTVNDWITRGILQVYGNPGDSAEIVIDTANAIWPGRTVVTTTATNANPMLAIRITVPRTNLFVGGLEQAKVYADYANTTNVDVTSLSGLGVTYQSTATGVATISGTAQVRAVGVGTATLNVQHFTLSNSVSVTVGIYTNTASMVHRYSFSEPSGGTTADSVGGSAWDGTVYGTLGGGVVSLDGASGYVVLPPGLVSNMDSISIEAWADFGGSANAAAWAALFYFGNQDTATPALGMNYIAFQPFTGLAAPTANALFGTGDPGYLNEQDATLPLVSNSVTNFLGNVSIAIVYNPNVGSVALYTNGVLAVNNPNVSNLLPDALGQDPLNYLGASLYGSDPLLKASISEFRIYKGPLTAGQIQADHALGPDQLIGSSTTVSLTAASAGGGNVVIKWPTTSALVNLMSSPTLGAGATWTPVSNGVLTVSGGNYVMTVPVSGARYFRLTQ